MKLKELTKIFFAKLPIAVRKMDVLVIEKTTADELALNAEFKNLREMEVFMVRVGKDSATITLK